MNNVRTCLGCRQRAAKTSLLRLSAHDGKVVMDHSRTLSGRGAWVHPSIDCLETALTRKAIGRSLRNSTVAIDGDALRQALRTHTTGVGNGALENRLNGPVNN